MRKRTMSAEKKKTKQRTYYLLAFITRRGDNTCIMVPILGMLLGGGVYYVMGSGCYNNPTLMINYDTMNMYEMYPVAYFEC